MLKYLYECQYCGKEYKPNRRHKQKYCTNSCRVNAFNQRKKLKDKTNIPDSQQEKGSNKETINIAGIGNAAIANVATDFVKGILTSEENKPVSKKDLTDLIQRLDERYLPVKNAPKRNDGTYAFYDKKTKEVKYLKAKW